MKFTEEQIRQVADAVDSRPQTLMPENAALVEAELQRRRMPYIRSEVGGGIEIRKKRIPKEKACGYTNRRQQNAEAFRARLAEAERRMGKG